MTDDLPATSRQTDMLDPARAQALQATLGEMPSLGPGDALPPFFHQVYFWTALPPARLGRDGHPALGQGLIPDMGLPRRMWAGGRLTFHAPLRLGEPTVCDSERVSVDRKTGRSGALALVTIRMEFRQGDRLCVTEERDLVYRADPSPDAPRRDPPQSPETAVSARPLGFDTTVLFRYSALTFNGHRIHYDLNYATGVEGYDGLVVHGPLLAQHLIRLAEDELGPLAAFRFRATAPLVHTETAEACRDGCKLWIRGPGGRQCMVAEAEPA